MTWGKFLNIHTNSVETSCGSNISGNRANKAAIDADPYLRRVSSPSHVATSRQWCFRCRDSAVSN